MTQMVSLAVYEKLSNNPTRPPKRLQYLLFVSFTRARLDKANSPQPTKQCCAPATPPQPITAQYGASTARPTQVWSLGENQKAIFFVRFLRKKWCRLRDLNSRPSDYKSDALPAELSRPRWNGCHYFDQRGGASGCSSQIVISSLRSRFLSNSPTLPHSP